MEPSFRLVPSVNDPSTASVKDTANSLGVHDTLRYGLKSLATDIKGGSALQQHLEKWEEAQDTLKLTMQRNVYGLHLPVRKMVERKVVASNPHMPYFSPSNIHLDILMGRDETLDAEDIFGEPETSRPVDIHSDMEKKLGLRN